MKTIISILALFIATFGIACGENEKKEEFTETSMIFWTVCNSIPMYKSRNGHPPRTSEELIQFFEQMGKGNEGIKKWASALEEGNLTVVDPETIKETDPYIKFQAKGEKDIYVLLKNGKFKKE